MARTTHTASFLDVTPYFNNPTVPLDPISKLPMVQITLPLEKGAVWHARILPMITNQPDDNRAWSYVREGQLVRVPLLPYRISQDLPQGVLGIMDMTQCLSEAYPNAVHTHIVIGTPAQALQAEDGQNVMRVWIGFAARTE
jgi:hypothetical protein